jgi:SAM-dependent methyltransferase
LQTSQINVPGPRWPTTRSAEHILVSIAPASPAAPDRAEHRAWLVSLAVLPAGGVAVDLGCGRGEDLRLLAARHPDPGARLVGVDASAKLIEEAEATADPRVTFSCAPLEGRLPFDDASVDLVHSHNLLECLADPDGFAREVARVLRPGGLAVIAHWDWDSQLFDGTDRALVRRLVAAYADWQQAWMAHADGWMGRRLRGIFHATGAFDGEAHARVLTNTAYEAPWFGHENTRAMGALVRRGMVPAEDYARFLREQAELAAAGRYFYAITGFAYVGVRRDS